MTGDLVKALLVAGEEQAAYVSGVVWDVSTERGVAEEMVAAGAVATLLHVVTKNFAGAKAGKSEWHRAGPGRSRAAGGD